MTKRTVLFIEIGKGVDLRGEDATKAASRAVRDAVGSNGLPGLPDILQAMPGRLTVLVKLALPDGFGPVDENAIKALLPVGEITVRAERGGLLTPLHRGDGLILVVLAVVEVAIETD
jgi:uncharacterized protein (TIGR02058 family)